MLQIHRIMSRFMKMLKNVTIFSVAFGPTKMHAFFSSSGGPGEVRGCEVYKWGKLDGALNGRPMRTLPASGREPTPGRGQGREDRQYVKSRLKSRGVTWSTRVTPCRARRKSMNWSGPSHRACWGGGVAAVASLLQGLLWGGPPTPTPAGTAGVTATRRDAMRAVNPAPLMPWVRGAL